MQYSILSLKMLYHKVFQANIKNSIRSLEVKSFSSATTTNIDQPRTEDLDDASKSITNAQIQPLQEYTNHNPRNLERLALGHKDMGWGRKPTNDATNYPKRNYYHRICLERTSSHTNAWLEHYHGREVIKVSTRDWQIRKHLYKSTDVTACSVLGTILVEMCIRSGISCAVWLTHSSSKSEATDAFLKAFKSAGFILEEPQQITFRRKLPHLKVCGPKPPKIV